MAKGSEPFFQCPGFERILESTRTILVNSETRAVHGPLNSTDRSTRDELPIDRVLGEILSAMKVEGCVVLRAPTGAGKTTRVPPAVLDAGLASGKSIIVLEPRRVAARAAASRMAQERACKVGEEIGYEVRFERQAGVTTKIKVVTEGVFLRMLQEDPFLENVGAVLFDEFHERNLMSDLALALVRKLRAEVRPDVRIVVMSATLETERLKEFLGNCPVVTSEGRLFPVEILYRDQPDKRPLHLQASTGTRELLDRTPGDVLVFLPGVGEIKRTASELSDLERRDIKVLELYGDLPLERQNAVLARGDRRKVVLATNVAETSVTIDGVTGVVDTGMARQLRLDPSVGLDRLVLGRISKASADQRAGRAGRQGPGVCLRLWTAAEQQRLAHWTEPEIRRVDLANAILEILDWGEPNVTEFPWFESPPQAAVEHALTLLDSLGATRAGKLTPLGETMARFPIHPRIARMLVEGHRRGEIERVCLLAALLSERDPFLMDRTARSASHVSESDTLDRLLAVEAFEERGHKRTAFGEIHEGAARFLLRARDQLVRLAGQELGRPARRTEPEEEILLRSLFAAFSDRLARRREVESPRAVMIGGRGVRLRPESAVTKAELFVCVDLDAGQAESMVRQASAVDRAWLDKDRLRVSIDVAFDPEREKVFAIRRTRYEDLILDEAATDLPDDVDGSRILAEAARQDLTRALGLDRAEVTQFLARVRCLGEWLPELSMPSFDEESFGELLPDLCAGCRSFADLRKQPLVDWLKSRLTPLQRETLDREAPERMTIPSGRRVLLEYSSGRPPVLAARIQELFGLWATPKVARGRVPILFHLLAPNMRPQQVTDDLESFWKNTYPIVRKELRRRYPKHAWPENPKEGP
ncbi:MAG: ATP-dependent helicase HrpB [Planctomycetota bacterium]